MGKLPEPGVYYPTEDKLGRSLVPGATISQPLYPRGTMRGVIEVSDRTMEVGRDGGTRWALVVRTADGRLYNLSGKACLIKGA